jgi:AraC family transcriptional regulator
VKRIQVIEHGQCNSWEHGAADVASDTAAWSGFALREHICDGHLQHLSYPAMQIELCAGGHQTCSYHIGGGAHRYAVQSGSLFIFPAISELTHLRTSGASKYVLLQVEGALLRRLGYRCDTLGTADIVPQHNISDEHIAALIGAMQDEIQLGCPANRLYGESLSLALISYIESRFGVRSRKPKRQSRQLSTNQLERVLEFIHSRLDHDLSLVELASLTNLSSRHFAQLFKNTLGVTPHTYVLRERVIRAKWLLMKRHDSISEIALSLGFGSQSYFTQVFRKVTGTTPKRYQREF